jgi:hypothetical protein
MKARTILSAIERLADDEVLFVYSANRVHKIHAMDDVRSPFWTNDIIKNGTFHIDCNYVECAVIKKVEDII